MSSLEQENRSLRERTLGEGFEGILGISPMMHEVFEIIRRVAAAEVPVLITGESGTGKELIARSIHRLSNAREGPFIAINCGAIPETLLESELFGHEKGSFTGADRQRQGKLELAAGGTLFLDEVGEMSLALQVKLLRFLQDGLVERVGGRHPLSVRTRVVAATHEDLKTGIRENRFREDLFYRLSVVQVSVPPLRDRGEDVVLIARALVLRYARELGRRTTGLSEDAVRSIRGHGWPGNVRELENRIKRAILMAKGPSISPSDLELSSEGSAQAANGLREMKAKMELEVVLQALTACDWNITHTAEHLRTTRQTLHFILKKYKLRKPQPKAKN